MSTETTTYNVYRVLFTQRGGPDHVGIALVPAQNEDQDPRRFYNVIGTVGLGMDYDPKPGYRFSADDSYKSPTFQFQLPKTRLAEFEQIARAAEVLYDPRVLTEAKPDPPARNCAAWVDDVLAQARNCLIVSFMMKVSGHRRTGAW
jgi:hypothetical protein